MNSIKAAPPPSLPAAFIRFFGEVNIMSWFAPPACVVGRGFVDQLLLRAIAPLLFVIALPLVGSAISCVQYCRATSGGEMSGQTSLQGVAGQIRSKKNSGRSLSKAVIKGACDWLPASLIIAFCFTPSGTRGLYSTIDPTILRGIQTKESDHPPVLV